MEHDPIAVQSVKDIQDTGKRWLEGVLGQPLRDSQQVFIMAFTPGVIPTEAARRDARAGLEQTWARVEKHLNEQGIKAEEYDAAVDEAMRHVRRREP
jgi:hypothetical protein